MERGLSRVRVSTLDDLRAELLAGQMVMWAVQSDADVLACIVLSVQKHSTQTIVYVELTAGKDLARWVDEAERLLAEYRDLIGADAVRAVCRDGMTNRLMKRGWKRKATVLELS